MRESGGRNSGEVICSEALVMASHAMISAQAGSQRPCSGPCEPRQTIAFLRLASQSRSLFLQTDCEIPACKPKQGMPVNITLIIIITIIIIIITPTSPFDLYESKIRVVKQL